MGTDSDPPAAVARRSAFFFTGRLDPTELANFNIQNLFLHDRRGAVLEVYGNAIAIWWPSRPRGEFRDLRDAAAMWFTAVASAYYLKTDVALEPRLVGWVEALDVVANEAVIGIPDRRFFKVGPPDESAAVNADMREAILLSRRLRGAGELERAATELLAAANDPDVGGVLSAFRALECVRRVYEPLFERRKEGWATMQRDLGISETGPYAELSKAAEAIRHGELPPRRSARHAVNTARRRRDANLEYVRAIVALAIEKHLA